jgi:hypothetical protein
VEEKVVAEADALVWNKFRTGLRMSYNFLYLHW